MSKATPPADTPQLSLDVLASARAQVPSGLWEALKHREQLFVAAYLADPQMRGEAAAVAAGFKPSGAGSNSTKLLRKPAVRAAVDAAIAARATRTLVDADYVITNAVEVLDGAKHDRKWDAANGSLTLMGKHLGMFEKRVRLAFDDPESTLAQLKAMPKAERVRVLRELLSE